MPTTIGLPEIISDVAKATGQTQQVVHSVLNNFLLQIEAARYRPEAPAIVIKGFGKFWFAMTEERAGRHPGTGKALVLPAARKLRFAASKSLLNRIQDKKTVTVATRKRRKSIVS